MNCERRALQLVSLLRLLCSLFRRQQMMAQRQSLPAYLQREDVVETIRDNQVRPARGRANHIIERWDWLIGVVVFVMTLLDTLYFVSQ